MNSAVTYSDKNERLWIDDFAPFVFGHVTRLSEAQGMKKSNAKKVEAIKHQVDKFKFAYFIVDTSEIEECNASAFAEYCNCSLCEQFKAGLEYVALLTPKNRATAKVLTEAIKSLSFRASIGMYENFERALHHTTNLWSSHLGRAAHAPYR